MEPSRLNQERKVVAGVFALAAFTVAIAAGLYAGNAPATVLLRAVFAMVICQCIGALAGFVVDRTIAERDAELQRAAGAGAVSVDEVVQPAEEANSAPAV